METTSTSNLPPVNKEPTPKPTTSFSTKTQSPNLTTHDEANDAAQRAIDDRINLLPNKEERKEVVGKYKHRKPFTNGLMNPSKHAKDHPATPILEEYAKSGCPVDCGPDWTMEQIQSALEYGAHPTAKLPEALKCLIKEAEEKEKEGFVHIVRWGDIKSSLHNKFKLSPVAMIPHKSRSFRAILDLSFTLKQAQSQFKSVNETTTKKGNSQAMEQLGNALKRLIARSADAQTEQKDLLFSKLDIKDGFWRLIVNDDDAWNFCYAIPNEDPNASLDDTRIVIPNSLQMGWCESPPFFCMASETARDVIQKLLKVELPPHPFEARMLPHNFDSLPLQDLHGTIELIEVFVDDFIGCTDGITQATLLRITRAMLHGIHSIFPPPSVTGHSGGDPISEKKLDNLDGLWQHVKEILGWIIDGANYTISLPTEKINKIKQTLKSMQKRKKVQLKEFQKIAGVLHHASMGIPGGRGLFTVIWKAMATCMNGWIKITQDIRTVFNDFKWLFQNIVTNKINVPQLVPALPNCHGYSDACKHGAGGVWILPGPKGTNRYILWSIDLSPDIIARMNTRKLSINDLEMAGVLLQWLVLEAHMPTLQHVQAGIECDNTSTVYWSTKFTARSLIAGHLLRALALRQQICKSAPLLVISIAGELNIMADVASRYSSDNALKKNAPSLLSYFNSNFKQETSWTEYHLPPRLVPRVMSSLQGTQLTLESWRRLPGLVKNIGTTGAVTQMQSKSTRCCAQQTHSSETWSLQHSLQGCGKAATATAIKLKFKQSLQRSRPSPRPLNWLDTRAPSIEPSTNTTSKSNEPSKAGDVKIPQQYHN